MAGRILRPRTQEGWDLLTPGRKPSGKLEIDWSNPLTHGLKHFYLFGSTGAFDLVTGQRAVVGSDFSVSNWGGQDGLAQNRNGGDSYTTSAITSSENFAFDGTKPLLITQHYFNDTSTSHDVMSFSIGSFNTSGVDGYRSNGRLNLRQFASGIFKFLTTVPIIYQGNEYIVCYAYFPNDSDIFLNGQKPLYDSNDRTTAANRVDTFKLFGNSLTNYEPFSGNAYAIAIHHADGLTKDQAAALSKDPYQILKPANDTPFLYAVGGGAQTINADFVSSATSVYEPTLTTGVVTISADFISAATSVYEPTVTASNETQDIAADFISASTSVYEPTITTGAVTIAADLIAAGTIVYEPTVSSAVNISADFIAAATSVYEPTVDVGAATITPDFIGSSTIVYEPNFIYPQTISADLIASGTFVYEPQVGFLWIEITPVTTVWTEI